MFQNVTVFEDEAAGMVLIQFDQCPFKKRGLDARKDVGPADTQTCTWMVTAALFSPQNLEATKTSFKANG